MTINGGINMKIKALSIILSIAMVFSCLASITSFSVSAKETTEESVYTIAGNNEELFGLIWYKYITKDNTMQKSGDVYIYELKLFLVLPLLMHIYLCLFL